MTPTRGYKRKVNNKMKGCYGETDLKKKTITINKRAHKRDKNKSSKQTGIPKKDMSMINTMVHEELHAKHPKMLEKNVRRKARTIVNKLTKKQKSRIYSVYR